MHPIFSQLRRLGLYLLVWIPIAGMLAYLLTIPRQITLREAGILSVPLSLIYALAFFYIIMAVDLSRETEARVMKASVLARDAELRALKAQVNPHFLFNSLNSISALTTSDAAKAREMCILLGDFLRRTLGL